MPSAPRYLPEFLLTSLLTLPCVAPAESLLPAYVLELPDSVGSVFIADTSEATIYRMERTPSGMTFDAEGPISIGLNGVGKQRAWDRKTPLGIYFVVDRLTTRNLHEKYGPMAFPLDYPNVWDRRHARAGDGIWVHGVAGGDRRPPLDTDGCLALPNATLRALADEFLPLVTPVIVTRQLEWADSAKRAALQNELRAAVARWAAALAAGDVHAYLSTYADDFTYRGLTMREWASLRLQTLGNRGESEVAIDDLLLLADPEEQELYLSRFTHRVAHGDEQSITTKRLYWQRDTAGELKIIAEDNG